MADEKPRYGSAEPTTAYEGTPKAGPSSGRANSAWALLIAAAFVIIAVAAVMFWPTAQTSPSSEGSAGSGPVGTSGPAQQSR